MSYINGKNARLSMVCENPTASIVLTGSVASATASASTIGVANTTLGIGYLGACDDIGDVTHKIKHLEGLSYDLSEEDDAFKPFGMDMEQKAPMRKSWTLTVTRKTENGMFRKLFHDARFGVATTAALHDGSSEYDTTIGYRFFLYNGVDTIMMAHGTMDSDGYKEALDSSKLNVETLKFSGNYWSSSVTSGSDFTSSVAL